MAKSKADASYRLVLFDAPDDPRAVRDLICAATGRHPTDVMQWVARAPGVWPQPIGEAEARAILDGLFELGLAAEAHRADALPALGPLRNVRDIACTPEGLQVRGLRGEPIHWLPWDRLELISAGLVDQPEELRVVAPPTWVAAVRTGLNALLRRPQRPARRERSVRIAREPAAELILARREPRLALRAPADALSYAWLGDRKAPTASANFRRFLAELIARADAADVTPETRALMAPPDPAAPPPAAFADSQALLDHTRLMLLKARYRRDREAAGP